jgi:hypothetical protein
MYTLGDDVPVIPTPTQDATTTVDTGTDETGTDGTATTEDTTATEDTTTTDDAGGDENGTDGTATTEDTGTAQPLGLLRLTSAGPATFGSPLPDGRRNVSIDVGAQLARPAFTDPVDGSYYAVDGKTTQAPYRPVQPLVDVEIRDAGRGEFGGFLITGLSSRDLPADYVPFYARPIVDNSLDEERIVVADGAFPATLQQVSDLGDGQRLLVAAGQYQGGQRLFDRISGELLPRPAGSTDTDAPRFVDVTGTNVPDAGVGRGIRFDVATETDATRVVIMFREENQPGWRSIELSRRTVADGLASWFGTAPLVSDDPDTRTEFFAQSVDASGNVGVTSNKIENFLAVEEAPTDPAQAPVITPGSDNQVGGRFFEGGATFTVTPLSATVSVDGFDPFTLEANEITISFEEGATPRYDGGVLTLDRGNHTIVATNDGEQVSRFFIVDPDAPELQFSRDTEAWTNQPVDLLVTANDGAGAGVATVCAGHPDEEPNCDASDARGDGVFELGLATIEAAPGTAVERTIEATATDRLGNERTDTTLVRVDNAPPTITVTPADGDFRRGEVNVTIDVADVGSGLAELFVNGSAVTVPVGSTSFQATVAATVAADTAGTFTVDVSATDLAGNVTDADPVPVRIDNARPVVTLTPPEADWSAENVDVVVAATDDGSGVALLCVDDVCSPDVSRAVVVGAVDGTFVERTITASATDGVGNVADTVRGTYKVDKAKPEVTVTPATTAWTNGPVIVTIAAADAGSGLDTVCLDTGNGCAGVSLGADGSTTATITADGATTVRATAIDQVGNETTSTPATVRIDTVAPVLDIEPNDLEFRRGPVEVVVSASDARSGLASVCLDTGSGCTVIELDDQGVFRTTIDVDGEGGRDLSATAVDVAGNTTTVTATQRIDNVQPVVALTPPNADWTADAVPVTIEATDTGSGVAELCVDGDCSSEAARSLVVDTAAGTVVEQTVTAEATDRVGNTATAIGVYRIDRAAPVVTVAPATTDWTNEPVLVTIAATDEGAGLESVCVSTGGSCTPVELDAEGTATITIDADGLTTVTATATDRVGNTTTTEPAEVRIDTEVPLVAVTPDTSDWRTTDVTLTVTGLDLLSGVASISTTTCVDGICSTPVVVDAATTTVDVTAPAGTVRTTTVEVVVTDRAGNENVVTRDVRIDRAVPAAALTVPLDENADGIYNIGEPVSATFSCSDVGSGLASCELLDGSTVLATTSPATVPTTTPGTRTLTVRATDRAGNTFVTPAVTVTVGPRVCVRGDSFQWRILPLYTLRFTSCDAAGNNISSAATRFTALAVNGTRDPIVNFSGFQLTYDARFVSSGRFYEYTFFVGGLPRGDNSLSFTTSPVPSRAPGPAELDRLATNRVTFRLR